MTEFVGVFVANVLCGGVLVNAVKTVFIMLCYNDYNDDNNDGRD